jgi:hypothetical protein
MIQDGISGTPAFKACLHDLIILSLLSEAPKCALSRPQYWLASGSATVRFPQYQEHSG